MDGNRGVGHQVRSRTSGQQDIGQGHVSIHPVVNQPGKLPFTSSAAQSAPEQLRHNHHLLRQALLRRKAL